MKIVVTGRHGQLAQALQSLSRGYPEHQIVTLARPEFDLLRLEQIGPAIEAHAPDLVVNAAAYTAVDKAETDADAALLINGAAAGAVATAAASIGRPIIHISTDFVFDGQSPRPYVEGDATAPLSVYGASKLLGEQLVARAAACHLILRTSWVISPYGHNFLKTMLRLGAERPRLTIVNDQHGAPTNAHHLANAILQIAKRMQRAERSDARWGVYHVANSGETTWFGLAQEVFAGASAAGRSIPEIVPIPTSAYPLPARRPSNSRLDCGKLADSFGITMPTWQTGVRECLGPLLTAQSGN